MEINREVMKKQKKIDEDKKQLEQWGATGTAYGKRIRKGKITDEDAVAVLVKEKIPEKEIDNNAKLIPQEVGGIPIDVHPVGEIDAQVSLGKFADAHAGRKERHRPVVWGTSIGNIQITAGTGTALFYDRQKFVDEKVLEFYGGSNAHVLFADVTKDISNQQRATIQPGDADGGKTVDDRVGLLSNGTRININKTSSRTPMNSGMKILYTLFSDRIIDIMRLDGTVLQIERANAPQFIKSGEELEIQGVNSRDSALFIFDNNEDAAPYLFGSHMLEGIEEFPEIGRIYFKGGRTTGETEGQLTHINATVNVNYGMGMATQIGQFLFTRMSAGGDSGSLIRTHDTKAFAHLFAGSDKVTVATPFRQAFDIYGKTLVTRQEWEFIKGGNSLNKARINFMLTKKGNSWTVFGKVTDAENGDILEGAGITLDEVYKATDNEGKYEFADVEFGEHHILAEFRGYSPETKDFELNKDGSVNELCEEKKSKWWNLFSG